jgi:hypothetical protein
MAIEVSGDTVASYGSDAAIISEQGSSAAAAVDDTVETLQSAAPVKVISPTMHAVLDYSVAGAYFVAGASFISRNRKAAALAFINGGMVLGMSLMTDYPGGVWRRLTFKGHRTGDIGQALLAGLGPALMGFSRDRDAGFFYGQAASEFGVIAATDWDAA